MTDQGEPKPIDPKYAKLTPDQAEVVATAERPLEEAIHPLRSVDLTPEQQDALKKMEEVVSSAGISALKTEQEEERAGALIKYSEQVVILNDHNYSHLPNLETRELVAEAFSQLRDRDVRRIIAEAGDDLAEVPVKIRILNYILNNGVREAWGWQALDSDLTTITGKLRERERSWKDDQIASYLDAYAATRIALGVPSNGLEAIGEALKLRGEPTGDLESYVPYILKARNLTGQQAGFDKAMSACGYSIDVKSGTYISLAPQGSKSA